MNEINLEYFLDSIESALCHAYVDRRVAQLGGFDVKAIDDFITERSTFFKEALASKGLDEMSEVLQALTQLSEERAKKFE